jgi:hypothetical protein
MRPQLNVMTDSTGLPYAEVSASSMWDLVEYLSYQRISVTYQYHATHFTVTFLRQGLTMAQQLLDAWASAGAELLQSA